MYVSLSELLTAIGKSELTRICTGKIGSRIDDNVLEAVLLDRDTTSYDANTVTLAQSAKRAIEQVAKEQGLLIDAYIQKDHVLPLAMEVIANSPLPGIATKLVHFELMLSPTDVVKDAHKLAISQLKDISNGVISLGRNDRSHTPSAGAARARRITISSVTDGF